MYNDILFEKAQLLDTQRPIQLSLKWLLSLLTLWQLMFDETLPSSKSIVSGSLQFSQMMEEIKELKSQSKSKAKAKSKCKDNQNI